MKKSIAKNKAGSIRYWKARKDKHDFVRKNIKKILALSFAGWPRMTKNPDYLKWLDIVYSAKDKGLFSIKSANCDVIANLHFKARDIIRERKAKPRGRNTRKKEG
jgi:hypothetical protein